MKSILAVGLFLGANIFAFAQGGIFNFSNVGTTDDRHIYIGEYLTGPKAEGDGYQIAIFWGPAGASDENALIQVGSSTGFLTSPGEGRFLGGARTITGQGNGPVLSFQARAWDASTGNTWAEAAANPAGRIGKGPIFEMETKDPTDLNDPTPNIGDAAGWRGFAIAVPEPSVFALALLALPALALVRRRH
jgi:hypothetical protein